MSERPTDTQPRRAATAHDPGRDERARSAGGGAHASAVRRTLADRAANFRQGAPFLVERATLYDPEPLDPPMPPSLGAGPATRRVLPAVLTLLGVVIVVGLAAGVLFVRNADVIRHDEGTSRLEQFSDRALPPEDVRVGSGAQPNSSTVTYDLTRRPRDVIVGAWRPGTEDEAQAGRSEPAAPASRQRPLPWRMSAAPPEVPPEPVTRSVVPAPAPSRYDAPEPKRRVSDSDLPPAAQMQAEEKRADVPMATGSTPTGSPDALPAGPASDAAPSVPSVVARVGRASEPIEPSIETPVETLGPAIEIPLGDLALPKRRPEPPPSTEERSHRGESSEARRRRLLRVQRKLRRQQRIARRRAYEDRLWIPEALYGNRFRGVEALLP